MSSRNNYLDFIKGIAIFLVIVGHVLQYSLAENEYPANPLFIFICSFHMPLFIGISGYLFYYSEKKTITEITKNKFNQLIIPLLLWSFIFSVFKIMNSPTTAYINHIINYIKIIPRQYWFLVVLFISSLLLTFTNKYLNKWYYHLLIITVILLIPDFSSVRYLKYMYPLFLIGYYCHKHFSLITNYLPYILTIACIAFVTVLYLWEQPYFIYFTDSQIVYRDQIDVRDFFNHIIRYGAGLSGSIVVLYFSRYLYNRVKLTYLQELGRETLGVYVIHIALLELIQYKQVIILPDFLYLQVLINSLLLLIVSYTVSKLLRTWTISDRLLFGGSYKKQNYSLKQFES